MLSLEDLREYCRTCLVKLESNEDDVSKSILINKFPELEHLIQVCVARCATDEDSLCFYAPFLCRSCFNKWLDFSKFYNVAIKTDQEIRKILEKEALQSRNIEVVKSRSNENITEHFINNESLVETFEIDKYERDSSFYTSIHSRNLINDTKLIATSEDDRTQPTKRRKHKIIKTAQLIRQQNENNGSNFEKEDDTDYTFNLTNKKGVEIKNTEENKSIVKSFCVLKKNYKTKKSLLKFSENMLLLEQKNKKNIGDLVDNGTKKVRYQCEQCNKYFWEKTKYDGHMKQVHEGIRRPYECQLCGKAYNLYKSLLQHKRESHSEKAEEVFKCDKCDKLFKTGVILKQHIANKHSEQKGAMRSICEQCGFIAAHQYSLSRHIINKHTETDHIKCDQCPKVFKTQYSLKYHVIGNHNPSNVKPFKCSECQMGFSRKTLLNQHKGTHLKYNERIKCDFEGCEVRFVKHGDKTHHMRLVHLKVKQHVCDFCGEAFGAMQTLRHHRFIHTGEKPYKCNVCNQGFRQRTAMNTHRKTHFRKDSGFN